MRVASLSQETHTHMRNTRTHYRARALPYTGPFSVPLPVSKHVPPMVQPLAGAQGRAACSVCIHTLAHAYTATSPHLPVCGFSDVLINMCHGCSSISHFSLFPTLGDCHPPQPLVTAILRMFPFPQSSSRYPSTSNHVEQRWRTWSDRLVPLFGPGRAVRLSAREVRCLPGRCACLQLKQGCQSHRGERKCMSLNPKLGPLVVGATPGSLVNLGVWNYIILCACLRIYECSSYRTATSLLFVVELPQTHTKTAKNLPV